MNALSAGLELEDVRAFRLHLVSTGSLTADAEPDRLRATVFCGVTLGEALGPEPIPHAREPRKLPVVLSADEALQLLEAVSSLKGRAAIRAAYAARSWAHGLVGVAGLQI